MMQRPLYVTFVFMLLLSFLATPMLAVAQNNQQDQPDLYFGVDIAYENIQETKEVIDSVSSFTNLFVIGCLGDYNETRLTVVSEYVIQKGLTLIVYSDDPKYPSNNWVLDAKAKWGDKFIGIYVYDEPGGKQVDYSKFPAVHYASDYGDAAEKYVYEMGRYVSWFEMDFSYQTQFDMFTSDYALYWYDYKAGYDTVFAEFGWNYSRQINVALVRGAATAQNKDWGVMLTWTYTVPPYIESGPELYNDMVLAYESGAKYIIVFDSNEDWTAGILGQEHLDAMKQFWKYTKENQRQPLPINSRTAYVLPENYAYGFRSGQDKIWGLWEADELSEDISMSVSSLLQVCNNKLDILYPDIQQSISSLGYVNVIYWNDPRLIPYLRPNLPDIPSPNNPPSSSPTQSPTPETTPTNAPTESPKPSSTVSPTEQPTSSTPQLKNASIPVIYVSAIFGLTGVLLALNGFILWARKVQRQKQL